MTNGLFKRSLAEGIGTFGLVFFGCGAIALVGKQAGLAAQILISLTFGIALLTMIFVIGPISGGHVNPAVTFGLALAKRFPFSNLIPYWIAQVAGSVMAISILANLIPIEMKEAGFAATTFAPHLSTSIGFGFEAILTFFLVFAVMATATNPKVSPVIPAFAIGFTLLISALAFSSLTGASLNPARTLGPSFFTHAEAKSMVWTYVLAQLVGGGFAGFFYEYLRTEPVPLKS